MNDSTRRTLRTAIAVALAILAALPVIVEKSGLNLDQAPWLVTILAVAAAITRAMSSPVVDDLLSKVGLGRAPAYDGRHEA